jgi:hypothetical protein
MWWNITKNSAVPNFGQQIGTNLRGIFKFLKLPKENETRIISTIKHLVLAEADVIKAIRYTKQDYLTNAEEQLSIAFEESKVIKNIAIKEEHTQILKEYEKKYVEYEKNVPQAIQNILQDLLETKIINTRQLRIISLKIRTMIKLLNHLAKHEKLVEAEIIAKIKH